MMAGILYTVLELGYWLLFVGLPLVLFFGLPSNFCDVARGVWS